MTEYDNSIIKTEPQDFLAPLEISTRTLDSMDKAVENLKQGIVSEDTDLSAFID